MISQSISYAENGFLHTNCGSWKDIKDVAITNENFTFLTKSEEILMTEILNDKSRNDDSPKVKTLSVKKDSPIISLNNTETSLILHCEKRLSELKISEGEGWHKQDELPLRALYLDSTFQVDQVSCGKEHTLILTNTGQVYSFGGGSRGQLGHSDVENQTDPKLIEDLVGVTVVTLAAGGWHSTAVSNLGDLYVWGWNESGQLGLPCKHKQVKHNVPPAKTSVSTSDAVSCADISSKEVMEKIDTAKVVRHEIVSKEAIGDYISTATDFVDQALDPLETHMFYQDVESVQVQSSPCALDLGQHLRVKKVACGSRHTVVLTENNMVLTCGWNDYGQLCQEDVETRDYLQSVNYFTKKCLKVTDIYCGGWTTIFVTDDQGTKEPR